MSKERILIVDDEPDILKTTRYLLEQEDYAVCTAATAGEALEALKSFDPDLVLLDLILPDQSGFQIARKITESKQIPIIILSCMTQESSRFFAEQKGAVEYFEKPIEMDHLVRRVKQIMQEYKNDK